VHAIAALGFFAKDDPDAGAEAALVLYDAALKLDPNSVLPLWLSAVRLGDLGRMDEALQRAGRAVDLSQRGSLHVGVMGRLLVLAGRRADALALREELTTRGQSGYIGPAGTLVIDVALGDEDLIADSLRHNIDAGTGLTSLTASGADRELDLLLVHPRLGPLVRQLQVYAERPMRNG
jgi:hypothetical protein